MGSPERCRRVAERVQASAATAIADSASFVEPRILRCPEHEMGTILLVAARLYRSER